MLKAIRFATAFAVVLSVFAVFAGAQTRFDVYFGMGTASNGSSGQSIDISGAGTPITTPSLDGVFGTLGGGLMITPSLGVGAQVSFRFRQGDYAGFGYRPVFYDFNGIWTPGFGKRVVPEFQAGFGGASMRFYDPTSAYYDYNTGRYTNYAGSSNHLQLHAGAGLRFFISEHIFVRPQLDYHWVRNFTEFKSSSVPAYSIAIGYRSSQ